MMEDHPEQEEPSSPNSLATPISQAQLATLKLQHNLSQIELQRLLGSAYFSENASLVIQIEKFKNPLVIAPKTGCFLGRIEKSELDAPHIDLTHFGAEAKTVSRLHALLRRETNTIAIEDLNSTNGTHVNGHRLVPHITHILHDGDEILLGALCIHLAFQYG